MTPQEILNEATAAAQAAARAQFERDGKTDRGHCGGTVMMLDRRSKLAQTAIEMGIASKGGECFVVYGKLVPDDVKTQHAVVEQKAYHAFRDVLKAHGQERVIKKMWDYVD